jgi:putative addiction module killer protein
MQVQTTIIFDKWLETLRDREGRGLILKHIDRMKHGNLGDVKNIAGSIFEKRIYFGAGYRLYFVNKDNKIIIILCGGNKSTQQRDIEKAKIIAKEL